MNAFEAPIVKGDERLPEEYLKQREASDAVALVMESLEAVAATSLHKLCVGAGFENTGVDRELQPYELNKLRDFMKHPGLYQK